MGLPRNRQGSIPRSSWNSLSLVVVVVVVAPPEPLSSQQLLFIFVSNNWKTYYAISQVDCCWSRNWSSVPNRLIAWPWSYETYYVYTIILLLRNRSHEIRCCERDRRTWNKGGQSNLVARQCNECYLELKLFSIYLHHFITYIELKALTRILSASYGLLDTEFNYWTKIMAIAVPILFSCRVYNVSTTRKYLAWFWLHHRGSFANSVK